MKLLFRSQLSLIALNLVVSITVILLGVTEQLEEYNEFQVLSHLLNLLIFLALAFIAIKNVLSQDGVSLYVCLAIIGSIVLEVEMSLKMSQGFCVFLYLRLAGSLMGMRNAMLKLLCFSSCALYLAIRLDLYSSPFMYFGLLYGCMLVQPYRETWEVSTLLEFMAQEITTPMLLVKRRTLQPIFYSRMLVDQYKYTRQQNEEFLKCLMKFESDKSVRVEEIFKKQVVSQPRDQYEIFTQEVLENCMFKETSKKICDVDYDMVNEQKIPIDSPKSNQQLQSSYPQMSGEDTPKIANRNNSFKEQFSNELQIKFNLKHKSFHLVVTFVYWDGEICYLFKFKDNSAENQIKYLDECKEQLTQQNKNKDDMLASIFHDFKTPINGIVAIIETMEDKKEQTAQTKLYLSIIKKNIYLMLYMIYDILDYSRIQRNQLRLCLSEFFINEIVDEVVELIAIQAQQKGVEIFREYDIPSYQLYSDPNRLKQILMNLLSNSLKFTEHGSIIISIQSLNTDKSDHIILEKNQKPQQMRKQLSFKSIRNMNNHSLIYQISVEDTGCGIPDSIKPKLFKMYGTYGKNNKSGTGLGLMICKKLVNLLGPTDEIQLESQEHKGTKMSFQIYARMPDQANKNYICVFKQEQSSQQIPDGMVQESNDQKFIRSTLFRVFHTKHSPLHEEIQQEDYDFSKDRNIVELKHNNAKYKPYHFFLLRRNTSSREDPLELVDPKVKIQKILSHYKFGIMIVDDEPFNVLSFKLLLQDTVPSINIVEAYNGEQAIKKLQQFQRQYSIKYIFLDLSMPIMDGWHTAQIIMDMVRKREIDPVYIIALTGYGFDDESEQQKCEKIGFSAFITKPVRLEIIAEIFAQLINR